MMTRLDVSPRVLWVVRFCEDDVCNRIVPCNAGK